MATEQLPKLPRILSLDPKSLEDVMDNIVQVGAATDTADRAQELVEGFRKRIETVQSRAALASTRPRVACLEWLEPLFFAGHWVPQMVDLAGGVDCLATRNEPSRKVEWTEVLRQAPEIIVLLPCGFEVARGLKEVHLVTQREGWDQLPAARDQRVYVTNASAYFSRSGPRLIEGLEMLAEIIHPELFAGMVPVDGALRIYGEVFKVS